MASSILSPGVARDVLLHMMRCDSEEEYCAGWINDNEYRLWCQIVADPVVAGEICRRLIHDQLNELAACAGGWWVWPPKSQSDGPTFVTMVEWLAMYDARRQALVDKYGPEGWAGQLPRLRAQAEGVWKRLGLRAAQIPAATSETGEEPFESLGTKPDEQ